VWLNDSAAQSQLSANGVAQVTKGSVWTFICAQLLTLLNMNVPVQRSYLTLRYSGDKTNSYFWGPACGTYRGEEKYTKDFGAKT
jgi:hypothetical protein